MRSAQPSIFFYQKNVTDARILHFFAKTDIKKLKAHQKLFLTYVLGGAAEYKGKSLWEAHKNLVRDHGLSDPHFDAVGENLMTTLDDLNVPDAEKTEIGTIFESVREQVLRGDAVTAS